MNRQSHLWLLEINLKILIEVYSLFSFGILQTSRADTGHWRCRVNRIHVDPVLTRSPAGVDVTDRLPLEIPGHRGENRDDGSPEQ